MTQTNLQKTEFNFERTVAESIRRLATTMQTTGVPIDRTSLAEAHQELTQSVQALQETVDCLAGRAINVQNSGGLARFLRDELGLSIQSQGPRGGESVTLEELQRQEDQHPIVSPLRHLMEKTLLVPSTTALLGALDPATSRIHPEIDPDRHPSGRFTCRNPALDSMPRAMRRYVRAESGNLLVRIDFKHFELRILAHLARDPALIKVLQEARIDPYRLAAGLALGIKPCEVTARERQLGKQLVFGIIYGQTERGAAEQAGCSLEVARRMRQDFLSSFPQVRDWMATTRLGATERGEACTEFGRRRGLPDACSQDPALRAAALRQAVNHVVQGTAAEHFKMRLLRLSRALPPGCRLLLPLHDGVLIEARETQIESLQKIILERMGARLPGSRIPWPVVIGTGPTWHDASGD